MVKGFKLRISRIFQSCRSTDPSNLPSIPVPSSFRPKPSPPPPSPFKSRLSSALGCGLRSKRGVSEDENDSVATPKFQWEREVKWHVIEKVHDESNITPRRKILDDIVVPPPPPPSAEKRKRRFKKKKTTPLRVRISTSSAESGLFSSESFGEGDDEETETLVSSRSFSTDFSPELNPHENPANGVGSRKKKNKKKAKSSIKPRKSVSSRMCRSPSESESPARLSVFQRLIPCTVEGKVRESFAVVKKTEDPYEDFKRSMMEMILEKEMFEEKDLEQLLHCFLSLNSRHFHGVIIEAFTEIWEALFCARRSTSFRVSAASRKSL